MDSTIMKPVGPRGGFAFPPLLATAKMLREADELPLSLVPSTSAALALIDTVVAQVVSSEQTSGRRARGTSERAKLKVAIGAIVGGLLRLWGKRAPTFAFRSLSKESFTGATVGFRQFKAVIGSLVSLGLIERQEGITYNANPFDGPFLPKREAARYWPTSKLLSLATEHGVFKESIKEDFQYVFSTTPPPVASVLHLKSLKGSTGRAADALQFDPHEPTAAALIKGVEAHNRLAEATTVTGCLPPRWCRIFTLDWTMHGRWYALGSDGNYQRLPEENRLQITIGGEPVAELDIRASYLSLMHGLLGLPAPEGDPYDVPEAPRKAVKFWVNASLGKGSPVLKWPESTSDEVRAFDAKKIGNAVISRYPFMNSPWQAVEHLQPKGDPKKLLVHHLMGIEASILSVAMGHLREPDEALDWHQPRVLTLPMHDGLIVPVSALDRAVENLCVAGQKLGKVRLNIKVSKT